MNAEQLRELEPVESMKILRYQVDQAIEIFQAGLIRKVDLPPSVIEEIKPLFLIGDFAVFPRDEYPK